MRALRWFPPLILAIVTTAGTVGCSLPTDTPPTSLVEISPTQPAQVCSGLIWACGDHVYIALDTTWDAYGYGTIKGQLEDAVDQWVGAVNPTAYGLPVINRSSSGANYTIPVHKDASVSSGTTSFCGSVSPGGSYSSSNRPTSITIRQCSTDAGTALDVMLNEMALLYGMTESDDHLGSDVTREHCASVAPVERVYLGQMCQSDVERVYYKYGLRGTDPIGKHVLTGASTSNSSLITLAVGDTLRIGGSDISVALALVTPSLCVSPAPKCNGIWHADSVDVTWSSSSSGNVSVTGSSGATTKLTAVDAYGGPSTVKVVAHLAPRSHSTKGLAFPDSVVYSVHVVRPFAWNIGACSHTQNGNTHEVEFHVNVDTDVFATGDTWELTDTDTYTTPGSSPTIIHSGGKADAQTWTPKYYTVGSGTVWKYIWARHVSATTGAGPWIVDPYSSPLTVSSCTL